MPWCTKMEKWTNIVTFVSSHVGGAKVLFTWWCNFTGRGVPKWTNMVDLVSSQVGGAEVLGQVQEQLPPKNLQVGFAI